MVLKRQNIPLKTLVFLAGILLSSVVLAQYSYIGKVINTVEGSPVEDVRIQLKSSGDTIQTDQNGAFLWNFGAVKSKLQYKIVNNIFYSPPNENVSIRILNLKGQKILETDKLGVGGTYLIPVIIDGLYILQIVSGQEKTAIKMLASNHTNRLLQKSQFNWNSQSSRQLDTLIFSKQGFYDSEISLPKTDTSFVVNLFPINKTNFDFLFTIPNYEVYSFLQGSPTISNQGEVESVKFIYNELDELVYFMNTKRHDWHFLFAEQFLEYKKGHAHFNATQYTRSSERFLYPGSINYYKSINKFVLRFYAGDEMGCSEIEEIYNRIRSLSYFGNQLVLYSNNTEWHTCSTIPQITSEELFEGQNYQALNLAKGFGYLRKVQIEDLNRSYLGKHDIVLLNGIPNDVSVVAGIITTEFQTPLSHINILSHNRKTPNMALRDGWTNSKLDSLLGELVYFEVLADSFIMRKARLEDATTFWNNNEPQTPVVLDKNDRLSGLINLAYAGSNSVDHIGGKAANFAELLSIRDPQIPTPENPFAIPFFYYQQHIDNHSISGFIEESLNDEEFRINQNYRKDKLEEIQKRIREAPINSELVNLVQHKINNFEEFEAYRFRSSTNAEDLEFFSGAGLYDSYSAKKDHDSKSIENAIRKVWAGLWNFRAFEEREYYKIDHRSVAMGILVHRSFPDEDANGVLITKNLYNINPGFIVNVQYKENSIVFPEPGVLHDQVILFTYSLDRSRNFTIEYLSHSNIAELEGNNVLSNDELYQLGEYCMRIKQHYFYNIPHQCNCLFKDFGLDIEFKIDSPRGKRKIYIKQVRIYN